MPCRVGLRDDDDDELEDREYPDDADEEDEDDDETVPCPHCLAAVYEDAERCPRCGHYLSREDAPRRHAWWLVVGVLICLALVSRWIVPW